MKACGIVFTDLLSLDGQYQNNPSPSFTSDNDVAGVSRCCCVRRVGLASVSLAKALGAKTVLAGLTMPLKSDAVMVAGAGVTIDDLKDNLCA